MVLLTRTVKVEDAHCGHFSPIWFNFTSGVGELISSWEIRLLQFSLDRSGKILILLVVK